MEGLKRPQTMIIRPGIYLAEVAERSELAVFVSRRHTCMIANQDGSVYSTRCSAANAVYREDQWQRPSKQTELES